MNQRAVVLSITLFLLVVLGMFVFAFLQKEKTPDVVVETPDQTNNQAAGPYADITRIDGKHFFIDGVHTVVGEIDLPTPCDLLDTGAIVAESYPEQITLDFNVINNAEFCAEVITPQRFKISTTASPEATFSARFQGRAVELNLIEALPGETPEDFELFVKG